MPTWINFGHSTGESADVLVVAEDVGTVVQALSGKDPFVKLSMVTQHDSRPMGDVYVNTALVRFVRELAQPS